MKEYAIAGATETVPLVGDVRGTPWADAAVAGVDVFPWDTGLDRQPATARVLYDREALYVQYRVEDAHSTATVTALNGPVSEDSTVELFARPDLEHPEYFNFEANCAGTILLMWGPDREHREEIDPALAAEVRVETSVDGPTKSPSADDDSWWLAAALPFETLSAFTGLEIEPSEGTIWRGNFQRLGGDSDFAVWNPIDAPEPDFHRPESFGRFVFE